jgi:hypothetical protein
VEEVYIKFDSECKFESASVKCPYCGNNIKLTIDRTRAEYRPLIGNFSRHLKKHESPNNNYTLDSYFNPQGESYTLNDTTNLNATTSNSKN